MRRISANYILPVSSEPIKNGVIEIDDDGTVLAVYKPDKELPHTEFYNGIIVPGFINTHSHLELAYTKGLIRPGGGLSNFLWEIVNIYWKNEFTEEQKIEAAKQADQEMWNNGIVAVGDISGRFYTAELKRTSKIYYHTFFEVLDDFIPERGEQKFQLALQALEIFNRVSLSCHATYDCSQDLIKRVVNNLREDDIFSIHNQESADENDLFLTGRSEILEIYKKIFKENFSKIQFKPTGKTALQSVLHLFPRDINVLLVHNIYTTAEDLEAIAIFGDKVYFSFNPLSNLYIEERLPDFELFRDFWDKCTVGTDSYASNTQLNILEELKVIPVPFEEKLRWATINGAKALNISEIYGSIEKGKKPGLVLIENFDFEKFELTKDSRVRRII